jgi:hypothetical protein
MTLLDLLNCTVKLSFDITKLFLVIALFWYDGQGEPIFFG